MKLTARLCAPDARRRGLIAEWLPANTVPTNARFPVDSDDPVFARILAKADEENLAFWVSGETVFTPAELAGIGHFELVCLAIARESPADFSANDAVRERTPPTDAGGAAPIRLVSGLSLTRITLKPNTVASIGDWTQEYVLAAGVVKTFIDVKLSGVSFRMPGPRAFGAAGPSGLQSNCRAVGRLARMAVLGRERARQRRVHGLQAARLALSACPRCEDGALRGVRREMVRTACGSRGQQEQDGRRPLVAEPFP